MTLGRFKLSSAWFYYDLIEYFSEGLIGSYEPKPNNPKFKSVYCC